MDTTSYRKINTTSNAMSLMRQFYHDYRHRTLKVNHSSKVQTLDVSKKINSATQMNKILRNNIKVNDKYKSLHLPDKNQKKTNSFYFMTKSRKQLEQCQDIKKGEFKDTYTKYNQFIRKYYNIAQKPTDIPQQKRFTLSIQDLQPSAQIVNPYQKRIQYKKIKQRLIEAQNYRKRTSANLRFNFLLKNKFNLQQQQQQSQFKHQVTHMKFKTQIDQFYRTKENIFPSCNI